PGSYFRWACLRRQAEPGRALEPRMAEETPNTNQPADSSGAPNQSAASMAAEALAGAETAVDTLASEAGATPQALNMPAFSSADANSAAEPTALSMLNDV